MVFGSDRPRESGLAKEFFGIPPSSDHNLYVMGKHMYQANYGGLRILDIQDPENPRKSVSSTPRRGETSPGFTGAWSKYPYFKSGVVAVTSMREGLFLIRYQPSTIVP